MRKYIDIINEFAASDFTGGEGGGGGQQILVFDIAWDHDDDGSADELPDQCVITVHADDEQDLEDEIADELSNRYGYCMLSYNYRSI